VFGAGMQAKTHIEAMLCVRPIEHVHIVNRSKENAEKLAQEIRSLYPQLKVEVSSAEDAIRDRYYLHHNQ